ncbi:MAG: site-2 protease family protein [Acidobacteriota bacterium]
MFNFDFVEILLRLPAIIVGLTFHEFAHAWVAYKLGDDTAERMGRLSLNPIDHFDPLGFFMIMFGPIGWAKPVPINPVRFTRKYSMRTGEVLVSIAGVTMNLLLAFVSAAVIAVVMRFTDVSFDLVQKMMVPFVTVNVGLMLFNLIPVPPLDGSKVVAGLLPYQQAQQYAYNMDRYGFMILLVLVVSGAVSFILDAPLTAIVNLLLNPAGLYMH